jgi:sulfotransferase family protein
MSGQWQFARHWLSLRWRKRVVNPLARRLYRDIDQGTAKSVLVAGAGRSGTTWLAAIVGAARPARLMFEPFHPLSVRDFRQFNYFQYMRPDEENADLLAFSLKVFTGDIRHPWIDRYVEHLTPRFRIVKEIRANLFLKWIHDRFPEVPLLFVIRHPCAVVLSRLNLEWATDADIEYFLAQPKLIEDFLSDKLALIKNAQSDEAKHAIVWCISNLVPIRQFEGQELPTVFYEHLCVQPEIEIPKIMAAIKQELSEAVWRRVAEPSKTTIRSSAVMRGEDRITPWQRELTTDQIDTILSIVRAFNLDFLYGQSALPLATALSGSRPAE